jgi:putative hydrolase of the HAD superfamily
MGTEGGSIRYLLVDLDETLYPSSSGMVAEISHRMTRFVAAYLKVDERRAAGIRRELSRRHGTTLNGLIEEYGLADPETYLEFTHPVEVGRYLRRDPDLVRALSSIMLPMSILTNSPREHAIRVLEYLDILPLFERIFDIRFNELRGKPDPEVYLKVLEELGRQAAEVLFLDNRPDYLLSFGKIGGRILMVSDHDSEAEGIEAVPRISSIKELPAFLASYA